jgi:hypothetical protein
LSVGAIGSYAFLVMITSPEAPPVLYPGQVVAASSLGYTGLQIQEPGFSGSTVRKGGFFQGGTANLPLSGTISWTLTGTWRFMGVGSESTDFETTFRVAGLWLRVS